MVEDIEEFKQLIKDKKILSVEEMQAESIKHVREKVPDIEEKFKKIALARGYVLEPSTTLEIAFNELILKTGGEDIVIDSKKKELNIITGLRDEIGGLSFKQKAKLVREIMEKTLEKPEEIPQPSLLDDFERFVAIRDIFAHVPVNWFSSELEFNDNPPYKHFFKLNPNWKNISVALNEFMSIQKGLLDAIPAYVRCILLKKKLISSILFGVSQDNPQKDASKGQ